MSKVRMSGISMMTIAALAVATPAAAAPADVAAKAEAYMKKAWPASGPGAAAIIVDDGRIVYAGGQGLADVEAGTPITADTLFRLGSITKQFSAAVLMQLVDEGKVSLDDKVAKFVPGFPEPGASATLAQLLNHTVGVQSYTGIPGWMIEANTNRAYTTDEMIALFRDLPAPSRPGEQWAYNNSGYVLVGAVIEKVTGKPWHQAVEERIARPLGLSTIRYGVGEENMAGMAKGYTDGEDGPKLAGKIHMSVPHAAGALVGNVRDLATWARAFHGGKVVSKDSYARMIAPTVLADGSKHDYGFGLGLSKLRKRDAIGHGGGIFGFSTDSVYIPSEDLFVAVFANSDDPATHPGDALRRLAALAIGEEYPTFEKQAVDLKAVEPLLGVYKAGEVERRFIARGGRLFTQRGDGPELEVFPAGEDRFFYGPQSLTWFRMVRDEGGKPVMEMYQQGEDLERAALTEKLAPEALLEVPAATLALYAGDYDAPRLGQVMIRQEAGGLTIEPTGQKKLPLRPVSESEFMVDQVGARIRFESDAGKVVRLVIRQGGQDLVARRLD